MPLKNIIKRIIETAIHVTDTFTHDGVDYDTQKVIKLIQGRRIIPTDISELTWIFEYSTPNPSGVKTADLSVPIIIAVWNGKKTVVDGLHRLKKATLKGLKQLPAIYVTQKDLDQCKI